MILGSMLRNFDFETNNEIQSLISRAFSRLAKTNHPTLWKYIIHLVATGFVPDELPDYFSLLYPVLFH